MALLIESFCSSVVKVMSGTVTEAQLESYEPAELYPKIQTMWYPDAILVVEYEGTAESYEARVVMRACSMPMDLMKAAALLNPAA